MKIAIVVGTRPEVIKMAPIIRECQRRNIDFVLIHSNQHYSENMDAVFFNELDLPAPKYNLHVGSGTHSNQIGNILIEIEPVLLKESPNLLLVQGDTNTVAASALAAHKLGIKVAHIEAGLRSYDRTMPEESNRVITDHISDYLFAVTDVQKQILEKEGIPSQKIHVVGNTIVDAVLQNRFAANNSKILDNLGLQKNNYCLFTAHRSSNVDSKEALQEVISILEEISGTVVWPVHHRTTKKLNEFGLTLPPHIKTTAPLGYMDFLQLEQNARLIITDSGGVQEEACILGIPCITIRENTERPETVHVGANTLVSRDLIKFKAALKKVTSNWQNPFGNGKSAEAILNVLSPQKNKLEKVENITVVGMGYMGIPTALLLADAGHNVKGFDIDVRKVAALNNGVLPFDEPGMPELFQSVLNSKCFSVDSQIQPADVYIVAVPTPHADRRCDLTAVIAACKSVASIAKNGDLVIIESTIKPGTCLKKLSPLFSNVQVDIVHCPERAIPGNTLHELIYNDRIIGAATLNGASRAQNLYRTFTRGRIFTTDLVTAEAVKLIENTYRDVNIAFANELSIIAEDLNFDVHEAIGLANRHPRVNILQPGPGVGGHCIAIDPWFLTEDTDKAQLITLSREINDSMPEKIVNRLYKILNDKNRKMKVGILGLAYKKNVDDARETPAEHIITRLIADGHDVKPHDPLVKNWPTPIERDLDTLENWADAFILVTDHDAYQQFKTRKPIVDTRDLLSN
jgi:UDP-N-acetylglucosamine 2-epimerase (non-hydrolysing)